MVDYLTGTSACRLAPARTWGWTLLARLYERSANRLSNKQREKILREIGLCSDRWSPAVRERYAAVKLPFPGQEGTSYIGGAQPVLQMPAWPTRAMIDSMSEVGPSIAGITEGDVGRCTPECLEDFADPNAR
jgi:hypothetical protein